MGQDLQMLRSGHCTAEGVGGCSLVVHTSPAGGIECPIVVVPDAPDVVEFLMKAKNNLTYWYGQQQLLMRWYTAYKQEGTKRRLFPAFCV